MRSASDLNVLDYGTLKSVLESVRQSILAIDTRLVQLQVEGDTENAPETQNLQPVLPIFIKDLRPHAFLVILKLHRALVNATDFSNIKIHEGTFMEFKCLLHYEDKVIFSQNVERKVGCELSKRIGLCSRRGLLILYPFSTY